MVEVHGRGTDFRFFYTWDIDQFGKPTCKYTFLLHKHTVLVGEHDERHFTLTDIGELLIYKTTERWWTKPKEVSGIVFPADHPIVKQLREALMEDWVEEKVLT